MKAQSALLALLAATSLMGCTSKATEPAAPQTQIIEISSDQFLNSVTLIGSNVANGSVNGYLDGLGH
jgi:hypothetical protein